MKLDNLRTKYLIPFVVFFLFYTILMERFPEVLDKMGSFDDTFFFTIFPILFLVFIYLIFWSKKGQPRMEVQSNKLIFYSGNKKIKEISKSDIKSIEMASYAGNSGRHPSFDVAIVLQFKLITGKTIEYKTTQPRLEKNQKLLLENGYPKIENFEIEWKKAKQIGKTERALGKIGLIGLMVLLVVVFSVVAFVFWLVFFNS